MAFIGAGPTIQLVVGIAVGAVGAMTIAERVASGKRKRESGTPTKQKWRP